MMGPHARIRSLLMKPQAFGTPEGAAASLGAARREAA